MNPAEHAFATMLSVISKDSLKCSPIFVFAAGADGQPGASYMSDVMVQRFTQLDIGDVDSLMLMIRLLTMRATVGLGTRWKDITATCFIPMAANPDTSVVGIRVFFAPKKPTAYDVYHVTLKDGAVNIVTRHETTAVTSANKLVYSVAERANPFRFINYKENSDGTLEMRLRMDDVPDGWDFGTTHDIADDILSLAKTVKHSPIEVTP